MRWSLFICYWSLSCETGSTAFMWHLHQVGYSQIKGRSKRVQLKIQCGQVERRTEHSSAAPLGYKANKRVLDKEWASCFAHYSHSLHLLVCWGQRAAWVCGLLVCAGCALWWVRQFTAPLLCCRAAYFKSYSSFLSVCSNRCFNIEKKWQPDHTLKKPNCKVCHCLLSYVGSLKV